MFKKGDKHKPANYRPVSFTSITCKLLEHIIHSKVMPHSDKYNILKDNPHGFRKKRSCETHVAISIQKIASRLNEWDVILLDFEKVFDKVTHCRLLYKLEYYDVRRMTSFLEQQKTISGD